MPEEEVPALVLPLGRTTLVVLAEWVEAIDDTARIEGRSIDLVTLLGLEADVVEPSKPRRALRVSDDLWLAAGHDVRLRDIPTNAFGPVPAWLGKLADRAPLASIVRLEGGFALEVDVARVVYGDASAWT